MEAENGFMTRLMNSYVKNATVLRRFLGEAMPCVRKWAWQTSPPPRMKTKDENGKYVHNRFTLGQINFTNSCIRKVADLSGDHLFDWDAWLKGSLLCETHPHCDHCLQDDVHPNVETNAFFATKMNMPVGVDMDRMDRLSVAETKGS